MKPRNRKPNLKMQASDGQAEIYIYDDIGPSWLGLIGADRFQADLKALGAVNEITVRINSVGGDVFEGTAIYNLLNKHAANVTVDIDGVALSIASVIAMAGDTIRIAENGMLMIHNPWTIAVGESDDMLKAAELLDTVKTSIVGTYASRTGLEDEELSSLMDEETWFVGQAAVDKGFATEVTANKAVAAKYLPQLHKFQHAPDGFAKLVADEAGEEEEPKTPPASNGRPNLQTAKAVHAAKYGGRIS